MKRLVRIVALSAHHGILTGAQGRSYEHTLRAAGSLELSGIARLIWGTGNFGRRVHALPQMAISLRDHGLTIPDALSTIADWQGDDTQEWMFAQGQDRMARLYHYKTKDFAMGTAAHYRWGEWGYQETVLQLRLGTNPDAQIWINHPGETIHSGYGRPSYWGGSGSLPRLGHYRGLAVMLFECAAEQPDFTHAWFPRQEFDASDVSGPVAVATSGTGLVLLKGDNAFELVDDGPTAGNELRLNGHRSLWIVRLGSLQDHGTQSDFSTRFGSLSANVNSDGTITIDDPEYGRVTFHQDGRVSAEGRVLDPANWTVEGDVAPMPRGPLQS